MARPTLATLDDLAVVLGEIADPEQAEALLQRASAIVRAYARKTWLDEEETELEDLPSDIPGVVVGMVERATSNAAGVTQESAGPFSRSFGADAANRLYLTAMDKLVIRAAAGSTGIGTLSTSRGPIETADVCDDWWAVTDEDLPSGVIW